MTSWQETDAQPGLWHRLGAAFRSRIGQAMIAAAAIALGSFLLWRALSQYSYADLKAAVAAVPLARIAASAGFAAASYATLTFFDYFALRYAGKPQPYPRAAYTSFVSLSLGHTIGLAALSSGAVRYRYYSRWGLSAADVAKVILFCGLTVGLGLSGLAGLALFIQPEAAGEMAGLSTGGTYALAAGCLAFPVLYVAVNALWRKPLRVRGWSMEMPGVRLALIQVGIGVLNFLFVAACLHQALLGVHEVGFSAVTSAYVVANAATLISHVPGGLGVIETVIQHLIPGGQLIGPLLVFRFTYFLVPLVMGALMMAAGELVLRRKG